MSTNLRILIAEDENISREILLRILQPFGRCDSVANGKLAVDAFRSAYEAGDPYGLVCLDIMMPELDGLAALDMIRAIERERGVLDESAQTRVIMTTALDDQENFLKAHDSGSQWYVTKPVKRIELLEALQDLGLVKG